jgi:hypothetical protein
VGVLASNLNTVTASNFSAGGAISMMFVDFILYAVLGWYLDKVLPSDYGTRRSYCFCFSDLVAILTGKKPAGNASSLGAGGSLDASLTGNDYGNDNNDLSAIDMENE